MFRVLFVCTGNRCRSPFAAASLAKLARGLPVEVESAGTADLGPVPPTVDAIRVAASHGVDVAHHSARSIERMDASGFDAIIGFERNHVAAAVVEGGAPHEKAFLLPELARLLQDVSIPDDADVVERARAALVVANEARVGFVPGEEVDDPIGRPLKKYQEVFAEIDELNELIVDVLFPAGATAAVSDAEVAPPRRAPSTEPAVPRGVEERIWGSAADPERPDESIAARVWGTSAAAGDADAAVEEPVAEAEPAAHESPIPEATST